ncbi:Altered inheritance of mitochondria protein 36, mitochondrial domain protein [Candida albicans]|uniref:Altered inheritance of mitochondria protein 36, mitochondrial domain protein n=1 Tax=Candida albicans TaxID=5476 RepID=A0A8H6BU72_CANAX|nr:Altered inheritance of mitochondria protein 36, mitochondrial domain protein [Candida albicans]
MNSKYKFYVIPYVHDEEELKKVANLLQHKDENATKDEGMKYHYLLEDLDEQGRPYPPGLITAVINRRL